MDVGNKMRRPGRVPRFESMGFQVPMKCMCMHPLMMRQHTCATINQVYSKGNVSSKYGKRQFSERNRDMASSRSS